MCKIIHYIYSCPHSQTHSHRRIDVCSQASLFPSTDLSDPNILGPLHDHNDRKIYSLQLLVDAHEFGDHDFEVRKVHRNSCELCERQKESGNVENASPGSLRGTYDGLGSLWGGGLSGGF